MGTRGVLLAGLARRGRLLVLLKLPWGLSWLFVTSWKSFR